MGGPAANPQILRLEVAYDGTGYAGWQIQPGTHGPTIQGELERALTRLYAGQSVRVQGSGRTDAGVHALGQVAHCRLPRRPRIPVSELVRILNGMLPEQIRVREASSAPSGFHARFGAVGKAYAYVIHRGGPDPFAGRWSWPVPDCRDLAAMRRAARGLLGEHDFSTFASAREEGPRGRVRTIQRIAVAVRGERLILTFIGDGFLYKMVRTLTATLVAVGRGRLSPTAVAGMLAARDRAVAPAPAPARGLFLIRVFYDATELAAFRPAYPAGQIFPFGR